MKRIITGHAPGHLRDEVIELIDESIDYDSFSKDKAKRLFNLLGKLWNCTDVVPSGERDITGDWIETYYERDIAMSIKQGCSYAMLARKLRPIIKEEFL